MKRLGRPFTIILIAFLLLVGILAIKAWNEKNSLQQNSKLVTGTVTSSSYDFMNKTDRLQIMYTYSVSGKIMESK